MSEIMKINGRDLIKIGIIKISPIFLSATA